MTKETFITPIGCRYYTLYILKLENDNYYIGITAQRLDARYQQHLSGDGAAWTRKHKPLDIIHTEKIGFCTYEEAGVIEDRVTLKYMRTYGVKHVRGGQYCYNLPSKKVINKVAIKQKKKKKKKRQMTSIRKAQHELDRSARLLGVYQ